MGEEAEQARHAKSIPGTGATGTKAWRWGYEVVRGLAQLEHAAREGNDIWKVSLELVLNDQLKSLDFIL